jgi:hypothetical protein
MDGTQPAVTKTAKQLALLAETLERRTGAAVSMQERTAITLHNAVASAARSVDSVIQSARDEIEQATRSSIDRILTERSKNLDREIAIRTAQIRTAAESIDVASTVARSGLLKHLRLTYLAIAGSIAFLGLGGEALIWAELSAYEAAEARATAAQIEAEVSEAYARVGLTSCGGAPCLKLDKKAPRWGKHGEYMLVEMKTTQD